MAKRKVKGLGDVIENITEATGIKKVVEKVSEVTGIDCGCDKRKEALNRMFSFERARCMTDEELTAYRTFKSIMTNVLSNEQVKYLCSLYSEVFKVPYYEPCRTCGAAPLLEMIRKLDEIAK